mgnify:CR=1 FL=1
MSLLGQGISQAELNANSVGASELDNGECVDGQIWKRAGGSWGCGADDAGGGLGYALQGGASTMSPPDGQTRFFGSLHSQQPVTVSSTRRIYIPRAGNIVRFRVFVLVDGTLGSSETVSHFVRLNDTTDSLTNNFAYDALSSTGVSTGSVAVVAGDFVEFKMTWPVWATNPTGVYWSAIIFIE